MKNIQTLYRLTVFCLLIGLASLTVSAASLTYSATTTAVAPGGSLTFEIFGESVNDIGGFSLYLQSSATGNQIQLTNQVLGSDFVYFGGAPDLPQSLNATPTSDLGAFSAAPSLNASTPYLLAVETIAIDPLTTPGIYSIFGENGRGSGSVFFDPTFTEADYVGPNNFSFNVVVVPEPGRWLMMMIGLISLLSYRYWSRHRI